MIDTIPIMTTGREDPPRLYGTRLRTLGAIGFVESLVIFFIESVSVPLKELLF